MPSGIDEGIRRERDRVLAILDHLNGLVQQVHDMLPEWSTDRVLIGVAIAVHADVRKAVADGLPGPKPQEVSVDRIAALISARIEQLEDDFATARRHIPRAHASGGIAALRKLGELLATPEEIAKDMLDAIPQERRSGGEA